MTPADVARVLTKAAAFDQRTIGQEDVLAWHEILHRVELADALAAVTVHYTESRDRIMPANVVRLARIARQERTRRERTAMPDALALPSRFETDEERNLRVKEGVAHCKDVLGPVFDMLAARREARHREAS